MICLPLKKKIQQTPSKASPLAHEITRMLGKAMVNHPYLNTVVIAPSPINKYKQSPSKNDAICTIPQSSAFFIGGMFTYHSQSWVVSCSYMHMYLGLHQATNVLRSFLHAGAGQHIEVGGRANEVRRARKWTFHGKTFVIQPRETMEVCGTGGKC